MWIKDEDGTLIDLSIIRIFRVAELELDTVDDSLSLEGPYALFAFDDEGEGHVLKIGSQQKCDEALDRLTEHLEVIAL